MSNVRILFTRKNQSSQNDDAVRISGVQGCPEMFHVVYASPEFKKDRSFTASYSSTLQYVEDILTSLEYDIDPFEMVQLMTSIHPTVMYHVADLCESDIRRIIMNQVRDSMRFDINVSSE